jgi:hypothetical protein
MGGPMQIRAFNIEQWAGTLDSRAILPALLRRLIHATVRDASRVVFPAWEGTQRPGWDGVVSTGTGDSHVPPGTSVWEIGTTADVKDKANKDFDKRTADPNGVVPHESTYICVTPRKWTGKAGWCAEKKLLNHWKDVQVYDSDDLEQWIENAPAVAIWFGRILGLRPPGVEDVERFWAALSALTQPPLQPEVFVASRDDAEKRVIEWLDGPPSVLAVECRDPAEVIDFVTATLMRVSTDRREQYLSRSVIVESREALDVLRDSKSQLALFIAPRLASELALISSASQNGHHILVPVARLVQERVEPLSLPRAYSHDLAKALEQSGFSEVESQQASRASGGSFTILKRRLARVPAANRPFWANAENASTSTPFLWLGGWQTNRDADRQIVARMSGRSDAENERTAHRLAECEEPLLIHVLDKWALLSRDDAWMLLGPHTTESDFVLFQQIAVEVLGEDDPRYDMPSDERLYANIHGNVRQFSSLLRKNMAETIALLASLHQVIGLPLSWFVATEIDAVIRRILPSGCSWKRWASLEGNLPLLAEASPTAFLDAIEADLASPQPELTKLLAEEGNPLVDGCHHAGLLWALETLAWSPSHLTRVSRILLDLWARDPGGQWGNRPSASLREIFSPWYPQTAASASQRVQVLDACVVYRPEVAWRLLHSLLPHSTGFANPTHRPYWRDWAATWRPGTTPGDYWLQVNACAQRVIDHAECDISRWIVLLDEIERLPSTYHAELLESLAKLPSEVLSPDDRRRITDVIRQTVSRSRKHPDARWSLPPEIADSLEGICKSFEPQDIALKYQWLFKQSVDHFEEEKLSHQEVEAKLQEARRNAISDALEKGGLTEVQRLASVSESPRIVGATLANLCGDVHSSDILPNLLASEDEKVEQFASGFIWQRFRVDSWPWVHQLPLQAWTVEASVRCLCCLPFERAAWNLAATLGHKVEDAYWHRTDAWNHELSKDDVEHAAQQLISRRRALWAVRLIRMAEHDQLLVTTKVVLACLEGILESDTEQLRKALSGNVAYNIGKLISVLQQRTDCDEKRLATLEWNFLRLLDRAGSGPLVLYRWLASHPAFFIEMLSCLYRSDKDEREAAMHLEPENHRIIQAESASHLLHEWRLIPGTQVDGSIDETQLRSWITEARALAKDGGYLGACDSTLGGLLSHSQEDLDGSWPCQSVRNMLDYVGSEKLLRGFEIGIYNSRGFVLRDHREGGTQEWVLANKFDTRARVIEIANPKTAEVLRRVAERYRHEARKEDERATWDR